MESTTAPVTPTPAGEWKGLVQIEGTDLELPSTNVARVKQLSPAAFMDSGLIPDPLRPIVRKAIESKKGLAPKDERKMMEDPKLLASAMELMDRTVCHVVMEPTIIMPPTCTECNEYAKRPQHDADQPSFKHEYNEGPRKAGVLYADQIAMPDKEFIFQWVLGGTRDLAGFRPEQPSDVGSTQHG